MDLGKGADSSAGGAIEVSSPGSLPGSAARPSSSAGGQMARRPATARGAVPDTAILNMMKRQMEALEDKLSGQISKVEKHGNQQWNNSLNRVESKMGSIEQQHPRINNKMAEISGGLKVVSDEMQVQIRRTEQVEARLWDRCRQIDEDVRMKISAVEQAQQQMTSSHNVQKVTIEEVLKKHGERLARLELLQEERQVQCDDATQSMLNLHARLTEIERQHAHQIAERAAADLARLPPPEPVDISGLEEKLGSILPTLDYLQQETVDIRVRVEAQEERVNFLRANAERGDERLRSLSERVERENCSSRLKEMSNYVYDVLSKKQVEYQERLEVLCSSYNDHQGQFEALKQSVQRVQERPTTLALAPAIADSADDEEAVTAIENRVSKYEERLETFSGELQLVRGEAGLAPRVTTLIKELKDLAPKVIGHDISIRDIQYKFGHTEAKVTESSLSCAQLEERLVRIEYELDRLRGEIEGAETDQDNRAEEASGVEVFRNRRPSATE